MCLIKGMYRIFQHQNGMLITDKKTDNNGY